VSFLIRQAATSDFEAISEILLEAVKWMKETSTSLWTDEEVSRSAIERDIVAGEYFLMLNGEEAAATFLMQGEDAYYWPDAQTGEALYLHRIAVRRTYSGMGHTRRILRFAVEKAKQIGLQYIRLDCDSDREGLNSLYTKLGFSFHSSITVDGYHGSRYQLDVMDWEYA
jgi:ribosomal protein S18 acetylase RimI-like enzyme